MGMYARLTCLRRTGTPAAFAATVRDLLKARNVVEAADPAEADRLLMIAPAGEGWLMVADHLEDLSASMYDADGLLTALCQTPDTQALDVTIADSDHLILSLAGAGSRQSYLVIGHRGIEDGALEPWEGLLAPRRTIDDIRKAFNKRSIFIEEQFSALKDLFGIDLAAFQDAAAVSEGKPLSADKVLMHLKAIPAPSQSIGAPKLEVDERQRENVIVNNGWPQIPLGLITHFPGFRLESRGGAAKGLRACLTGTALDCGLIEIVSAELQRRSKMSKQAEKLKAVPEPTPAGVILRFPEIEVRDWLKPDLTKRMGVDTSAHDLLLFVYCRALQIGEGELEVEAHFLTPPSAPVSTSCPVAVLPDMWRPLRSSEQPHQIYTICMLNDPARINALAVLRGGAEATVSALRKAIDAWWAFMDPAHVFDVRAIQEAPAENAFFKPATFTRPFTLDPSKKRQPKWDRLMADLPSLHALWITDEFARPGTDYAQRYARRAVLQYTSAAPHPNLPDYAARLGHVSLSLPASPEASVAVVSLMRTLAEYGVIRQAYVGTWDGVDEPGGTAYERAADNYMHQKTAHGWGTRYLRAVADRMWLGPEFAAMLPDRAALERVAIVEQIGESVSIERRSEATLRDLELCVAPLLPTAAEGREFGKRIVPRPPVRD